MVSMILNYFLFGLGLLLGLLSLISIIVGGIIVMISIVLWVVFLVLAKTELRKKSVKFIKRGAAMFFGGMLVIALAFLLNGENPLYLLF